MFAMTTPRLKIRRLIVLCVAAAAGCTSQPPAAPPAAPVIIVTPPAAAPAEAPAAVQAEPPAPLPPAPAVVLLHEADRLRTLSVPDLAQEIARLGGTADTTPQRQVLLALALAQTRVPSDLQRAQGVLARVLNNSNEDARVLHPLARLLAAQYNEQRRVDESADRQAQQLRDAQRRIDQLNDRLEAMRAVERSLSARPSGAASAPRPAP